MKRNKVLVLLIFILFAGTTWLINDFINYHAYTLQKNGNWVSSKVSLKKGVVAAYSTLFTKVTLARNTLNLNIWHGYQEFVYKEAVPFQTFDFKVRNKGNPFAVILHKNDTSSFGIYFNGNAGCFFFHSANTGEFLQKNEIGNNCSLNYKWNKISIKRHSNSFSLFVNGSLINQFEAADLPEKLRPGFKGFWAYKNVFIDDVIASNKEGILLICESFRPPFSISLFSIFTVLALMVINFFLIRNTNLVYTSFINFLLLFGLSIIYFSYFFYFSTKFSKVDLNRNWFGINQNCETKDDVCRRLENEFPVADFANQNNVLFIGTSQTWGAGASDNSKTFPALLNVRLKECIGDSINVINAGIPGYTSSALLDLYLNKWHKYNPKLVVINLSTNDTDTLKFRKSIRNFVDYNNRKGIKTLLIAEPNDNASERLKLKHRIVMEEAIRGNVRSTALQKEMDLSRKNGFMWWDYVHPSDYGYQVIADLIFPLLVNELQIVCEQ